MKTKTVKDQLKRTLTMDAQVQVHLTVEFVPLTTGEATDAADLASAWCQAGAPVASKGYAESDPRTSFEDYEGGRWVARLVRREDESVEYSEPENVQED